MWSKSFLVLGVLVLMLAILHYGCGGANGSQSVQLSLWTTKGYAQYGDFRLSIGLALVVRMTDSRIRTTVLLKNENIRVTCVALIVVIVVVVVVKNNPGRN